MPVPEAPISDGEHGRRPAGPGWFVLNLGEAVGARSARSGIWTELEPPRPHHFETYGINVHVVMPGQPNCLYHEESNQEDFLVLHGECIAIVEEQERRLQAWDFLHCPPGTRHVLVGAGEGPCAILMVGARDLEDRTEYPASEVAARYGAAADPPTSSGREAYRDFPPSTEERFPWPLRPVPVPPAPG
jgi:uncharacterized cupin superfamily protein